jgi:maleylacetate reductase
MNALVHCVEAFYGPGANPITSLLAEEGVRVLARGLPVVVREPTNLDARSDTLMGAYLAGTALAAAGVAIHHQICHVLGGTFGLPHADLNAVVLPHATRSVSAAVPDEMSRGRPGAGRRRPGDRPVRLRPRTQGSGEPRRARHGESGP